MGVERRADRMDISIGSRARTGAARGVGSTSLRSVPLGFFIAWHCSAKAFLYESMTCCSTGPKLGGILDSANHSGWPYGILSLIAWHWAYCSAGTPIKQKTHPISSIQTV